MHLFTHLGWTDEGNFRVHRDGSGEDGRSLAMARPKEESSAGSIATARGEKTAESMEFTGMTQLEKPVRSDKLSTINRNSSECL